MAQTALAWLHPEAPVHYPESDGEPMAETDRHRRVLSETVQMLERHFRSREEVYVSGNLFFYYEEGNPNACKAPDVFVVTGVPKKERRVYKLWEEGWVPTLVVELTSKKTKKEDEKEKPRVYARLGVPYLFLYDPYREYLNPPLQGFELGEDGRYRLIPGPKNGPYACRPLGLELFLDGEGELQFLDRDSGEVLHRLPRALDKAEAALVGSEAARTQEKLERIHAEAAREKAERERAEEAAAREKAELERSREVEARKRAEEERNEAADALREARLEIERLQRLADHGSPS